jgi:hypothetical protein
MYYRAYSVDDADSNQDQNHRSAPDSANKYRNRQLIVLRLATLAPVLDIYGSS